MMRFIHNDRSRKSWIEFLSSSLRKQCLDSSHCSRKECVIGQNVILHRKVAYTSASPEALYFVPCSISTDQEGNIRATWLADWCANSTELTIIKDLVALGLCLAVAIRDRRFTKTVVFPEPVGRDTPIRVEPDVRASIHESKHSSWYGRSTIGAFALE